MENFTFYAPTYFAFGKDTENDTGKYVKRFGGSRVLLHYGGGSVIRSGLLDRVKKSLDGEGVSYVELGGVKPNPRSGLVYEGIDLCRKEKVDFVLAVGGGSTIDSAKAIAAGAVYDGDFWDYYEGKLVEEALPITGLCYYKRRRNVQKRGNRRSIPSEIHDHEPGTYTDTSGISDSLRNYRYYGTSV